MTFPPVSVDLNCTEISTAITNRNFVCLSKITKNKIINRLQQLHDGDAFYFLFPRPITRDTIILNMSGKCKMTNIRIVWGTNAFILNDFKHAYLKQKSSLMLASATMQTLIRTNPITKTSCWPLKKNPISYFETTPRA